MTSPATAPPGHQARLFDPTGGAAPQYRVIDRYGQTVVATAALGVAVTRAAILARAEGWAWITDSAGAAALVGADGSVTSDTATGWLAALHPKENP